MNRRARLAAVACSVLWIVAVAGCGDDNDPKVGSYTQEIDGVKLELPGRGSGGPAKLMKDLNYTVDWGKGPLTFKYDQGRISLDGKDYGTVTAGDRVRVTTTRKVYVNDKARKPAS